MSRYAIGIDFGTTNSCCAFIDLKQQKKSIEFFKIPQLVESGEIAERTLLPSFVFIPEKHEKESGMMALPWDDKIGYCVGELARRRSVTSPGRTVSSAKSWLCNSRIDRKSPVLPWTQTDESIKISPFEAVKRILSHIRDAWNYKNPLEEQRFEKQDIVLTVPASFDDSARELTVEAAAEAGLSGISLLEEPQSAFYFWLSNHELMWKKELRGIGSAIVCDVGGGTTDFTLISAETTSDDVILKRTAVGDHLLLGGDNMDMSLALMAEKEYVGGTSKLGTASWAALSSECRAVKERLLSENAPEYATVTVLGRGSSIMRSAISARISREGCLNSVIDGFFPEASFEESRKQAPGLSEWGLPFQKDPRITAHMADFIKSHLKDGSFPDAVLFNGGVFRSDALRERMLKQLEQWAGRPVRLLESSDLDLAVAGGAAYFALVRTGEGVRIGGGSPRSYYVRIGTGSDEGYLCLIPKDLMTETVQEIKERVFSLKLDFPVSFSIFSSNRREDDLTGDIIDSSEDLTPLPPLFAVMPKTEKKEKTRDVYLKSVLTEIGILELFCAAESGNGEWKLRFGVARDEINAKKAEEDAAAASVGHKLDPELVERTRETVIASFDKKSAGRHENLLQEIESIWDIPREQWHISLNRLIFDALLETSSRRKIDPKSEGSWFNAAGFVLRPGFGYPLDEWRIGQAEALIPRWLQHNKEQKNRAEWHIFWRRCAGGLSGEAQRTLFDRVSSWLFKGKKHIKSFSGPTPNAAERREIYSMLSYFDKLPASLKKETGDLIMEQVFPRDADFACSLIKRIGGRRTIFGGSTFIVPPNDAVAWAKRIISKGPRTKAAFAAVSAIGMITGDGSRDIEEGIRAEFIKYLKESGAEELFIMPLLELMPEEPEPEEVFTGDSMPPGLTLKKQ